MTSLKAIGQLISEHPINKVLEEYNIRVTTISFHPNGECLISTGLNRNDRSQYLLLLKDWNTDSVQIDTLEDRRPNRSAFSEDGSYLYYNITDPISEEGSYTIRRSYSKGKFGHPEYISLDLKAPTMYYYWIDDDQSIYYYIWFGRDSEIPNGLYYSAEKNGKYSDRELILPDRENAVAFSPLLLNDDLMIFFQHGKKDNSTNGAYYSKRADGKWGKPIRIEELPYGASFTYDGPDKIAFIDNDGVVKEVQKNQLILLIN